MTQSEAEADKPGVEDAQSRGRPRYCYTTTWRRDHEAEDQAEIQRHLDEMATNGWELVSANAIQWLQIKTEHEGQFTGALATTFTVSVMRHYFYWRQTL